MFVIVIPVKDLLESKVFKGKNFTEFRLIEELIEFYRYRPYTPKVWIDDDLAYIEIQDELIARDEAKYNKVVSLCENGKFKEAEPKLRKLLEASPTVSEYNRLYGQILSEQGKQEEAVKYLTEAIKWDYNNLWAFVMLGNIYMKHFQDLDKAMKFYERAAKIDPKNAILINNIGANLASRGKLDEALKYFYQARSSDPDYPNSYYGIALVQERKNLLEDSIEWAAECMKRSPKKDALYNQALQTALESASFYERNFDAFSTDWKISMKIQEETGKRIDFVRDENLSTAAQVQIAEYHDRDHHIIKFNPKHPGHQHLFVHEAMHIIFASRARAAGRNKLYTNTNAMRESFIRDNEQTIMKLVQKGYPEENVGKYITDFYKGLNMQLFNTSVDLLIEDTIYKEHPKLRPIQFLSLYSIVKAGVDACTSKKARELSPRKHLSNSRVLNALTARHLESMYGVKMEEDLNCDFDERKKVDRLYQDYMDTKKSFKPGDEYDLVDKNARVLGLEKYYALVLEQDYKQGKGSKTTDPIKASGKQLNMAVVMYMVSAINHLLEENRETVRKIAFEIAEKGRGGIDLDSTEMDQTLVNVPGKMFTGLQLTAWMYVSWKFIEPGMDLALDYDDEYDTAVKLAGVTHDRIDQDTH